VAGDEHEPALGGAIEFDAQPVGDHVLVDARRAGVRKILKSMMVRGAARRGDQPFAG